MNRATLIRYTPLYVSLTITAIVLTVLLLLPGAALGLVVEVDTPENDRNSLSGFALGEAIPINARVNLEGEFETLISELEIEQISGGPGFINVTGTGAVSLPLEPVTGDDLSDQLSQGTLSADVAFILVTINPIGYPPDGSAYGYVKWTRMLVSGEAKMDLYPLRCLVNLHPMVRLVDGRVNTALWAHCLEHC